MGNIEGVESKESFETVIGNMCRRIRDGTVGGTQPDVSPPGLHPYSMNLVTQTGEEDQIFRGPTTEDMEVQSILSAPWKGPMNINLNTSTELPIEQDLPEVQWSMPTMMGPPMNSLFLGNKQIQKFEAPAAEAADDSRGNNSDGKYKVEGDIISKEPHAIWPPVLGFSSGRFPKKTPLYPVGMASISTQLAEFTPLSSDRNHVICQEQPQDWRTTRAKPSERQTPKTADGSATKQGVFLAKSNCTALESMANVTQPPNNVFSPVNARQNIGPAAKAHPVFAFTFSASEATRGHPCILTPDIQEKMTQEKADTRLMAKTNPVKGVSISTLPPSPRSVPKNTPEETQVKSATSFSYADALKRSLQVKQQVRAPKLLGQGEEGLIVQQRSSGHQNKANMEKKGDTKTIAVTNVRQSNAQLQSKNPKTNSRKSWNPSGSSTPPSKATKGQLRLPWTSCNNPKDHFQFKGSCNVAKHQGSTPNNSTQLCKNTSTGKSQEQVKLQDAKKEKVYQSYPIKRTGRPKPVCNLAPTFTSRILVKSKDVSIQPLDISLQAAQSFPVGKPARENNTIIAALEPLNHKDPLPQSEGKEHNDASDLTDSASSVPDIKGIKECPNSKDQIPDQSLVDLGNEAAKEPTTTVEVLDNISGAEKDEPDPDVVPKHRPSGRWKDFYVDNSCTMKCRCKHRPGKLPPNVVRWFSVAQDKLAGSDWVTPHTIASSLLTGTKILQDHPCPCGEHQQPGRRRALNES